MIKIFDALSQSQCPMKEKIRREHKEKIDKIDNVFIESDRIIDKMAQNRLENTNLNKSYAKQKTAVKTLKK